MKLYIRSAAKHYPVKLSDGSYTKFVENCPITKVKTILGAGTEYELRVAYLLESRYHIPSKFWSKCRGECSVYVEHKVHRVELHWYEAKGLRYEYKVKYDFGEGGKNVS